MKLNSIIIASFVGLFAFALVLPAIALAHCDSMNGPVVTAAQKALETGNVNLALIWVQKKDEAEIKEAFNKTLAVRKVGPDAQKLADMYFFETVVRIHRAGEGAPYTGLKPAGTEVEPGIEAADQAVEKGSVDDLVKHLSSELETGVRTHFAHVARKKNFRTDDVEAGREYVEAYVVFIHYVERLYQSASALSGDHTHEAKTSGAHDAH